MNDLVATLGINNLSKSQVPDMAKELDEMVADFRAPPTGFKAVLLPVL
ncbi:transposase-like protein [Corynebacterium diphtheriae]|nr:transposase-like protein [Corynebacterium diphtheriae]